MKRVLEPERPRIAEHRLHLVDEPVFTLEYGRDGVDALA